jgi:hypothetical protein
MTDILQPTQVGNPNRAEHLLTLWREQRRLAHRVCFARMRFELIGLDPDEQDCIAAEVAELTRLIKVFAAT